MSITRDALITACDEFKKKEGRASYYDIALEIVEEHPLHASLIILAVWNVSRWRFMVSDNQNLIELQTAIEECKPLFEKLNGKDIKTVNLDEIEDTVKAIYSKLSKIKGVEYTGTSKVMHLLNRDLFVMWDTDIRRKYGFHNDDADDYFCFLKKMQDKFSGVVWNVTTKTFAKAIDEYNHVTITIPLMEKRYSKEKQSNH